MPPGSGIPGWLTGVRKRALWCAVAALALAAGARPALAQSFCQYEITSVIEGPSCGILGPALVDLLSINDLGQACGFYRHCATNDKRPFAWSEETGFVILPLPEGVTNGEAVDINNVLGSDGLGQVVCTLLGPGLGNGRAYLYDDGAWTLLPPSADNYSEARAINDQSQVSGDWTTPTGWHGFRWEDGAFIDIVSPIGGTALGLDISTSGNVTGQLFGPDHAFRWEGEIVDDLNPLLVAITSTARAMNSRSVIVGGSSITRRDRPSITEAYVLQDKFVEHLGIPSGFDHSVGLDINNAGQVLVLARRIEPFVLNVVHLWQHGEMVPIVDLVEPLEGVNFGGAISALGLTRAINSKFITNTSTNNAGGAIRSFGATTLVRCEFYGNSAESGGAAFIPDGTAVNCLFAGNQATNGSGGAVNFSNEVHGCTFADNYASDLGAGATSLLRVTNSIFWGNDADGSTPDAYKRQVDISCSELGFHMTQNSDPSH